MGSDRFLARTVARPVNRFLEIEAAGGILLTAAAAIALVWANSPWSASYHELWGTVLTVDLGGHVISEDLRHWINDGLMTLFFFIIGVEIRQEVTDGQLASPRTALVPAAGALGGMVVPALIYAIVNRGGPGADGWGVPMATDVAFAVAVLALLGRRVPASLKVLLLGLAIVDDIGAILVIAVFYSGGLDGRWFVVAAAGLLLVVVAQRVGVRFAPFYVAIGVVIWLATFEAEIHPTIAGVALGLLTPARPLLPPVDADAVAGELSTDEHVTAAEVRDIAFRLREAVPVTERLQDLLHPWTSYVIVPLFALANAGVVVTSASIGDAASSPVTLGIVAGLVGGKLLGVTGAMLLATRWGGGRLPEGVTTRHVVGMAGIAGIGFTVSLFVVDLAFDDPALADQAKLGVVAASLLAALVGAGVLLRGGDGTGELPRPERGRSSGTGYAPDGP